MENKFCFLKGMVDCDLGRIQDCNNKRTDTCILEEQKKQADSAEKQNFCFLMGMVDCSSGCVQDCNNKRVQRCPKK